MPARSRSGSITTLRPPRKSTVPKSNMTAEASNESLNFRPTALSAFYPEPDGQRVWRPVWQRIWQPVWQRVWRRVWRPVWGCWASNGSLFQLLPDPLPGTLHETVSQREQSHAYGMPVTRQIGNGSSPDDRFGFADGWRRLEIIPVVSDLSAARTACPPPNPVKFHMAGRVSRGTRSRFSTAPIAVGLVRCPGKRLHSRAILFFSRVVRLNTR